MYEVGSKIVTKSCGTCTITKRISKDKFEVTFEDGYKKSTTRASLRDTKIKNPYYPTVFGKGFIGEGFKCSVNSKLTKEYALWISMMIRCYSGSSKNNSYAAASVCDSWLNFQNFALWCSKQHNFGRAGYELDKDLLIENNKEYNEVACCLLPKSINSSLSRYTAGFNPRLNTSNKLSVHYYCPIKKRQAWAYFGDIEAAAMFYKANRFNRVKELLQEHADNLEAHVVARLIFLTE